MFELYGSQRVMYLADKKGFGQVALLTGSVIIPRKIDMAKLQDAANEVFRINDGLRAYFIEKDGKVYQDAKPFERREFKVMHFNNKEEVDEYGKVYGTIPLKLDIRVEGSDVPKERRKTGKPSSTLVKNILTHKIKMFFTKLRMGILNNESAVCEIILLDLPDSCGAMVKIHHIIADAWTVMLIANQFFSCLKGETITAFKYEDFIESEKKYRLSSRYERDCEYMESEFAKCPEQTWLWPEHFTSLEGKRRIVELDKEFSAQIYAFCDSHNVTPFILFLSAVTLYMRKKLNRDKFYVGSVSLNRTNFKEKNTVGMFITGFPVLMELNREDSYSETMNKIKDKSLIGLKHQKGTLVTKDRSTLYDIWVSYQNATLDADPTAVCTEYYCNSITDRTVFSIEDRAMDGRFKLHFDHNIKVSEEETDKLFDTVISYLHKIIDDPDMTIE